MSGLEDTDTGLKRQLGLISATLSGMGIIVGAGIYVIIGIAAGHAGNAVWLSFVIAAIAAGFTGLSYARLGHMQPKNAPEFHYLRLAFGEWPGFLAGWLVLWALIISASTVSLGFAEYLNELLGIPVLLGALGIVIFSSVVVFRGINESIALVVILTVPTIAGIMLIAGIGIPHIGKVNLLEMSSGVPGVMTATSLVFFAYVGFESITNLSEEMKNPRRDLPRAIILSLAISALLYALVALSAVSVLGWRELSQSAAPLTEVARQFGGNLDLLLSYIALAATASTILLLLLAASRAMWAMSCAGALPAAFCVIGRTHRTPWKAIIVVSLFAGLFVATGRLEKIAQITNFAVLLAFAGINASAIRLLGNKRDTNAFKHVLISLILPGLGVIVSLWLAATTGWRAVLAGMILLAIGVLVHLTVSFLQKRNKVGSHDQKASRTTKNL